MKAGATDYLLKERIARLPSAVKEAMEKTGARRARAEAESAPRESEPRYRTLADSGQALIWTSGVDKKCDYFNQPWLAFTGRTLEQELGDGWAEGVHPDDLAGCLATYAQAFDRREPFSMNYRLRDQQGEFRWIQDDGTPRYDIQGNFLGCIGHCLDITDRKRAEEQLRYQAALLANVNDAIVADTEAYPLPGRYLYRYPAISATACVCDSVRGATKPP